jgi:hypothetical protein
MQSVNKAKNFPLGSSKKYPTIIGLTIPPILENTFIIDTPVLRTLVGKDSGPIVNIEL